MYLSHAIAPFADAHLQVLLAHSRQRNAERGITGLLLHGNEQFLQVLEGEPAVVGTLYERIGCDPRHLEVITLFNRPVARRLFADWSMAHLSLPTQQFMEYVDYATQASQHPDPTQADQRLTQLLERVLVN